MQRRDTPGDDSWAEMREAQALAAKSVPNSGVAVTIDTGDADDIHPEGQERGRRTPGLCALADHYGVKVSLHRADFTSVERAARRAEAAFRSHRRRPGGEGRQAGRVRGRRRRPQVVLGGRPDRRRRVIVSSKSVPDPKAVRYAWQANPVATLFNGAGLPAAPFRTDNWPGVTEGNLPY